MRAPLVHLNGSGSQRLAAGFKEAGTALYAAQKALQDISPHGRDYYPLGDEAYLEARREHEARLLAIETLIQEMGELYGAVLAQKR